MKFGFVAKHRGAWPVLMMCNHPEQQLLAYVFGKFKDNGCLHQGSCFSRQKPTLHTPGQPWLWLATIVRSRATISTT